jgi:hypothetical protein
MKVCTRTSIGTSARDGVPLCGLGRISIQALVQPDNAAARRVLDRAGSARPRLGSVAAGELEFGWTSRGEEDSHDGGGTGRRVL